VNNKNTGPRLRHAQENERIARERRGLEELAARLANVAGALQVQKPGTATVSRAELLAELEAP